MTGKLRHEEPPELWNGWDIVMADEAENGDRPDILEPIKGLDTSGQ